MEQTQPIPACVAGIPALLKHIAANPGLPEQLRTLFDLALYESGHANLSHAEKQALKSTMQLALLIEDVKPEELRLIG